MHGTSTVNVVEPVNDGTSDSMRAHWNECVVAPQRSGAPNSSTSRARVGVIVGAPRRVDVDLARQRDRVDLAPLRLGDVQVEAHARARGVLDRLGAEDGELERGGRGQLGHRTDAVARRSSK